MQFKSARYNGSILMACTLSLRLTMATVEWSMLVAVMFLTMNEYNSTTTTKIHDERMENQFIRNTARSQSQDSPSPGAMMPWVAVLEGSLYRRPTMNHAKDACRCVLGTRNRTHRTVSWFPNPKYPSFALVATTMKIVMMPSLRQ